MRWKGMSRLGPKRRERSTPRSEENKALARRFIEEAFNQGNLDVIDEVISSEWVQHDSAQPDGGGRGRQHARNFAGFTGSSVWHRLYFFPPTSQEEVDEGFRDFAEKWNPILDVFDEEGVRFALEVHPTEISYDIYSTERALEAIGRRKTFGFNFDPSHLYWQFVDPARFVDRFGTGSTMST